VRENTNYIVHSHTKGIATFQQHLHVQLIRYSRDCGSCHDVLDRGLLFTIINVSVLKYKKVKRNGRGVIQSNLKRNGRGVIQSN